MVGGQGAIRNLLVDFVGAVEQQPTSRLDQGMSFQSPCVKDRSRWAGQFGRGSRAGALGHGQLGMGSWAGPVEQG